MVKRNPNFSQLKTGYLFPEIQRRKCQFLNANPQVQLISLGIGDTTEPIPPSITEALLKSAQRLGTREGYLGYGPEQGMDLLRKQIASTIYQNRIQPEEVFISDGAKCDLGRLQMLFGANLRVAIQDPAYPVYVDGSIIQGVQEIHLMPCTPERDFFPDLTLVPQVDLIYICSPNNPTGAVYTRAQLEELVFFAKKNRSLILFDAAYSAYIQDPSLPKTIFEIDEAREVALEVGSFSKLAGFTGIRLGWTVVPHALAYEQGGSIRTDWNRITTTLFNGASLISQYGGLAVLEEEGRKEIQRLISFYMENARLLKEFFQKQGYEVFGGSNAPYLWVRFPGRNSWEVFQELLEQAYVVTTPGSGFGRCGEGFLRLSAYGSREQILYAIERLTKILGKAALHP